MRTTSSVAPLSFFAGFQEGPSFNNLMASSVKGSPGERRVVIWEMDPSNATLNFRTTTSRLLIVSPAGNRICSSMYIL